MQYYFIGSSLPDLQIGMPPEISFGDFDTLLKENLSREDYEQTLVIRLYFDLQNIRAFWKSEEMDKYGNLDENSIEDALIVRSGLPDYVFDFLEKYESKNERLKYFSELSVRYFQEELKDHSEGFLHEFLKFEREWRLVLVGFRAKKLKRDIINELQFEDPNDEIVAQLIAQKDAKVFEPPTRYSDLKAIFEEYGNQPIELHQALVEWRFEKLFTMYGDSVFSLDRILSYLVRLILVEKWMQLDQKKGIELIDSQLKQDGVV
ncbi:MAG: DUF2764 family protein [Waddliaceae bacterium]